MSTRHLSFFIRLAWLAVVLAAVVVVLGAYVRLSDAGLGCPDWPGCYGRITAPREQEKAQVARRFERPLVVAKAWKEMVHRYVAGLLGLCIAVLGIVAWRNRRASPQPVGTAVVLLGLVIVQAALGMWTVTWLLKPLVVTLHLLGGMSILSLCWWLVMRSARLWCGAGEQFDVGRLRRYRRAVVLAFVLLAAQIALGGWTSSNYAALACPDFPACHGQWWPNVDFREAFVLWGGIGLDYEGGVLSGPARVAIHLTHRLGALVMFLYIVSLALAVLVDDVARSQFAGHAVLLLALVVAQVTLGIANVLAGLPLAVAVAHNAVAAALLLALVALAHRLWPPAAAAGRG